MSLWTKHKILETNAIYLLIAALIVISIGGLVEIVPLFYLKNTIETVDGVRPYTPLELAGRNIYVREGCYNCHSQMIRPLRDEVERYGHYSLAAESMYDRPFQWGSKRTGPDLARVGGKYSDAWQLDHLRESALGRAGLDHAVLRAFGEHAARHRPHRRRPERPEGARRALHRRDDRQRRRRRAHPGHAGTGRSPTRCRPLSQGQHPRLHRDRARRPARLTEADALIAYLQSLGTEVDFKLYDDKANIR